MENNSRIMILTTLTLLKEYDCINLCKRNIIKFKLEIQTSCNPKEQIDEEYNGDRSIYRFPDRG